MRNKPIIWALYEKLLQKIEIKQRTKQLRFYKNKVKSNKYKLKENGIFYEI